MGLLLLLLLLSFFRCCCCRCCCCCCCRCCCCCCCCLLLLLWLWLLLLWFLLLLMLASPPEGRIFFRSGLMHAAFAWVRCVVLHAPRYVSQVRLQASVAAPFSCCFVQISFSSVHIVLIHQRCYLARHRSLSCASVK